MNEFEDAKDKVMMGAERRSMVMDEDEKKLTAYHEAGHAIVGIFMPGSDPIHKATIIPRGRALGMVMRLPEKDQLSMRYDQLIAHLAVAMGGRVAEEIIFGKDKITTGAASDIQQATGLSRRMITEWGYSDKVGMVRYSSNEEEVFLGHSVTQQKNISEHTAEQIDEEIRRLIDEALETARRILTENLDLLHRVAQALLEYETLSGDEIQALKRGENIDRPEDKADNKPKAGPASAVPETDGHEGEPDDGGMEPEPQPGS
jgi:cell division protease FtsH